MRLVWLGYSSLFSKTSKLTSTADCNAADGSLLMQQGSGNSLDFTTNSMPTFATCHIDYTI